MASRSAVAAFIAATVMIPLGPAAAQAAGSGVLPCGSTITTSTVLRADVTGCAGDGLVLAGDHVTLDLNRHTVSGDGIPNANGFDVGLRVTGTDVRVRNGSVSAFDRGLLALSSPGLRLTGLAVHDNSNRGIMLDEHSDGARIEHNISSDNGASGIAVVASNNALVTHNRSVRNVGGAGVRLDTADGVLVADNDLSANTFGAQIEPGADANTVTRNAIVADLEGGVVIGFSNDNVVTRNRMTQGGNGVITESADRTVITDNVVTHSKATLCDGCGIAVQIYGNDNLVARNTLVDSPRYGIELDDFQDPGHSPASGNVLRDNVVDQSGIGMAIGPEAGGVVTGTVITHNIVTRAVSDGIQLIGPSTGLETSTLTRNVANRNGGFGIVTVPGTIDGGGNRAAGNGSPAQCLNIVCM
jgi:Right handed beta helix region